MHLLYSNGGKIQPLKIQKPAEKDIAGLELVTAQYHASDLLIIHHHPAH